MLSYWVELQVLWCLVFVLFHRHPSSPLVHSAAIQNMDASGCPFIENERTSYTFTNTGEIIIFLLIFILFFIYHLCIFKFKFLEPFREHFPSE